MFKRPRHHREWRLTGDGRLLPVQRAPDPIQTQIEAIRAAITRNRAHIAASRELLDRHRRARVAMPHAALAAMPCGPTIH